MPITISQLLLSSIQKSPRPPIAAAAFAFLHGAVRLALATLWLSSATCGYALDPSRSLLEHARVAWSVDSGLPQSTVSAIVQSTDGYLWLATHEGLARFDGRRFFVYNEVNAPALRGSGISALLGANDGGLWIGLRDGGVVRYAKGTFSSVVSAGIPVGPITSLSVDSAARLWVGSSAGGVGYVAGTEGRVFTVKDALPHDSVQAIEALPDDQIYVGTASGVAVFRGGSMVAQTLPSEFSGSAIGALRLDRFGRLWIGVAKRGLFVNEKGAWRRFAPADGSFDQVNKVMVDRDGLVWVASVAGLSRINEGRIETLTARDGLSANYVRALLEDTEGSLWVGTEGGLERFRDGNISVWEATRGLSEEFTRAVLEDSHGDIWVGTANGLFRARAGKFQRFAVADGLVNAAVLSLAEDAEGTLWVGTNLGGLHYREGERFVNIGAKTGRGSSSVRAILPTRAGHLWVGTATGLVRFDQQGRGEVKSFSASAGIKNDQILSLYEDKKGQIWVGTRVGVYVVKDGVASDTWRERGITGAVFAALADGDNLLLATGRGLVALKGDAVIPIGVEQGLPNRSYFQLLNGDAKNLWTCSNAGMVRIPLDELRAVINGTGVRLAPQFFDRADGMATAQCNGGSAPAGWKARDGRVLFPTAKGVAIFDPKRALRRNALPPPVHITGVAIDNDALAIFDNVLMPRAARRIEISYVGLSFADADRVRYRYRLEGFDGDWNEAGREQTAAYTNLPSGQYRFRVIAANHDGVWGEEGESINIVQVAALHERWWFRLFALALLLLLIGGAFLYRVRAFRRQSARLQVLVDERTHELATAIQRLDMMAHLDGLTAIANRRRLDDYLPSVWAICRDQQRPLAVLMIDVDFFKRYNDTHGHLAGDEVLKSMAQLLHASLHRTEDLLARYGGEEFIAVLPGADVTVARLAAEGMRKAVEASPLGITVSIGVHSQLPSANHTPTDFIAAADSALYAAKHGGRNRVNVSAG